MECCINKASSRLTEGDTYQKLPVYETVSSCFIGPYQKEEDEPCFHCFIEALKANNSPLLYIIEQERVCPDLFGFLESYCAEDLEYFRSKVIVIDKSSGETTVKEIHKNPFCPNCSHYVHIPKTKEIGDVCFNEEGRTQPFKEVKKKLEKHLHLLIDRDCGVGKSLFRDAESDAVPMYGIESFLKSRPYQSYGRSTSLASSKLSAVLEMIERHASMVPHFKEPIKGSYQQLLHQGYPVVNPEIFLLNKKTDDESVYSSTKEYYWSSGIRLDNQVPVLLPEQVVYFDHQLLRGEERFIYETSNGTAIGNSFEEAIIYGLFELIERDHFLVHWYCKKLPKLIRKENINDERIISILNRLENQQYDVYLFDITLETLIPTVWVLAVNKDPKANLTYYNAAGCHYNPEKAIFSGLVEVATSALVYEKRLEGEREQLAYLIHNPEAVRSMEDHVNYYAFAENGKAFDFLLNRLEEMEPVSVSDMHPDFPFSFKAVTAAILKEHPDIYVCDLSNLLTEKLDFSVVKTFIPSMQPMTFGIQNERLNSSRLKRYGNDSLQYIYGKEPHPFP